MFYSSFLLASFQWHDPVNSRHHLGSWDIYDLLANCNGTLPSRHTQSVRSSCGRVHYNNTGRSITVIQVLIRILSVERIIKDKFEVGRGLLLISSSIPHIITDAVLVGFPVPLIWKFHIHRPHKILLTAVFAVGVLYVALFSFCLQCSSLCIGAKPTFFC